MAASDPGIVAGAVGPASPPRTAEQVIDQAISENKFSAYLLYGFALAGGVASGLFWPAMNQARQIRRENIAIRLLERPLSMADTSNEAANALKDFFVTTFIAQKPNP